MITKNCNLNCKYCYEKNIEREDKGIDFSIAKDILNKYLNADDNYEFVIIDLFGGEPFLNFPLIKKIHEYLLSRKWKKNFNFFIQTNGTLLTNEIKEWLLKNKNNVVLGLSFDGSREAHNLSRDNSYDLVMKNIPFFKSNYPRQFIKCTICAETIPYVSKSLIEMENLDLLFTANIGFEDIWGDEKNKKKLLNVYEDQLSILVDFYTSRNDLFLPGRILTPAIECYYFDKYNEKFEVPDYGIKYCGSGHGMIFIDTDGKEYPCHRYATSITGRIKIPKIPNLLMENWKPDKCSVCKLIDICPTCVGYNFEINGDPKIRTTFHCESFKLEVLATAKIHANRIEKMLKNESILNIEQKGHIVRRLDAILEFAENGI
ncbi:MAG: 4Fe-4S cluster-binding domain-containing protein [Candidatus Marinimicrobia bacterium]|nr:4Fe-4S cluster-binding domain-containing protein [Candidatus Neomarinimicrobiota bacterium]